jgi:hypothetical protein
MADGKYTIECTKDYNSFWSKGDAFDADTLNQEGGWIVGKDIDGERYHFPLTHFTFQRNRSGDYGLHFLLPFAK